MSVELTEMSYEEYNRIRTGQMTPAMASEYLKEGRIALRSFRECLMEMVPGRTAPEVAAVLQEAGGGSEIHRTKGAQLALRAESPHQPGGHLLYRVCTGLVGSTDQSPAGHSHGIRHSLPGWTRGGLRLVFAP